MSLKDKIAEIVTAAEERVDHVNVDKFDMQLDNLLIAPIKFKDTGIVASVDQYEDKNEYGVVIGGGMGRVLESGARDVVTAHAGDVVLYGKYSYTKIRIDGVDLNIIKHSDVVAVLPPKE